MKKFTMKTILFLILGISIQFSNCSNKKADEEAKNQKSITGSAKLDNLVFLVGLSQFAQSYKAIIAYDSSAKYASGNFAIVQGTSLTMTNRFPNSYSSYSISSSLPTGLVINSQNGNITGTPTTSSSFQSFSVDAKDSKGVTFTSVGSFTLFVASTSTEISNRHCESKSGCSSKALYSCSNSIVCYSTLDLCYSDSACRL